MEVFWDLEAFSDTPEWVEKNDWTTSESKFFVEFFVSLLAKKGVVGKLIFLVGLFFLFFMNFGFGNFGKQKRIQRRAAPKLYS